MPEHNPFTRAQQRFLLAQDRLGVPKNQQLTKLALDDITRRWLEARQRPS